MDYRIRQAKAEDIEKIYRLILRFAKEKLMLPRSRSYLRAHLDNYQVAICQNNFVGVCGLRFWAPDKLEVISLAVKPRYQNQGIGTALIAGAVRLGVSRGFKYFFTLTMSPKRFEKNGFKIIDFSKISAKVQTDCRLCPKNNAGPGKGDCNEIPLELIIIEKPK